MSNLAQNSQELIAHVNRGSLSRRRGRCSNTIIVICCQRRILVKCIQKVYKNIIYPGHGVVRAVDDGPKVQQQ